MIHVGPFYSTLDFWVAAWTIWGHPMAETSADSDFGPTCILPHHQVLTWHGHSVDIDLLDEVHHGKSGLHLCRGHVLTFPARVDEG